MMQIQLSTHPLLGGTVVCFGLQAVDMLMLHNNAHVTALP